MSGLESTSPEDQRRFRKFREDSIKVLQEIDLLRSSLKDTTKAFAEEYNIEPKKLTVAIRTAYKSGLADKKAEMDDIEEILHVSGYDE